jgi:hypothetical protein
MHSDWQKRHGLPTLKVERPPPMKLEQAWKGFYPADDNINVIVLF